MFKSTFEHDQKHQEALTPETMEIIKRLNARNLLLDTARTNELKICPGAAVILEGTKITPAKKAPGGAGEPDTTPTETGQQPAAPPEDILEAVQYRLAITDLFVEKAQYHLEERAARYERHGKNLYAFAIALFVIGTVVAGLRMFGIFEPKITDNLSIIHQTTVVHVASTIACSTCHNSASVSTTLLLPQHSIHREWISLLKGFIVTFTAYGFLVLTAVALTRGARACLDQRERLLAKRHSLRQGRLFLHLAGGRAMIDDMERAFNWNHEQQNAFTNMPTDAKAPWGNVIEEIIKIVPELVKTGVAAAEKKNPSQAK